MAVSDDGQRFQRGAGIAGWLFRVQAVQVFAHLWAALETPAAGHLDQLNAFGLPLRLQLRQQRQDVLFTQGVLKQGGHVAHAQGLLPAQERGFQDSRSVCQIHDANSGGGWSLRSKRKRSVLWNPKAAAPKRQRGFRRRGA